jgi:hypothetical protein
MAAGRSLHPSHEVGELSMQIVVFRAAAAVVLMGGVVGAFAGDSPILVNKPFVVVARLLERELPAMSMDGLFEANRKEVTWELKFLTARNKISVDEVTVVVRQKTALSSEVIVEAAKITGGLIGSKRKVSAEASAEWSERIRDLVTGPEVQGIHQ